VPTLLRTIAAVLREAGVDETLLRDAFAGATTAARTASADHPDALAGSVIELWNSDPEYLGRDGSPRGLAEAGAAPSIQALLRRAVPARKRNAVLTLLRGSPSVTITTDGVWSLTGQNMLRVRGVAAARRMTIATEALLRTELRSLGALGGGKLMSRTALTEDIPDVDAMQLNERAVRALRLPIEELSAWLESCRRKRGKRTMREVGIVAFAYQLPKRTRRG
jgi:hypothetical protein